MRGPAVLLAIHEIEAGRRPYCNFYFLVLLVLTIMEFVCANIARFKSILQSTQSLPRPVIYRTTDLTGQSKGTAALDTM